MARFVFALCLIGALVVAANAAPERKLQQFSCSALGQVAGKCCQLCSCVAEKSGQKALKESAGRNLCIKQCNDCVGAAGQCKGNDLPSKCTDALKPFMGPVSACISDYRANPGAISNFASGC